MKTDLATNLRVLEDNGFCDVQARGMPPAHVQLYIEGLLDNAVMHDLKTLAWLIHDYSLILHAAPKWDDCQGFDEPDQPFRRVGTMTRVVKIDKGARRASKNAGLLKRVQGYLECGRPYGTGLVVTPRGAAMARELAETDIVLNGLDFDGDDRLVSICLESIRKFASHFLAVLYEEMGDVVILSLPRDLTPMFDVDDKLTPLVSAGLNVLADHGQIVKSNGRYRRAEFSFPSGRRIKDMPGARAAA